MPCGLPWLSPVLTSRAGTRRTTEAVATGRRGCSIAACRVAEPRKSECEVRNGDCPQAASVAAPATMTASLMAQDIVTDMDCPSVLRHSGRQTGQFRVGTKAGAWLRADLAAAVAGQPHAARNCRDVDARLPRGQ